MGRRQAGWQAVIRDTGTTAAPPPPRMTHRTAPAATAMIRTV